MAIGLHPASQSLELFSVERGIDLRFSASRERPEAKRRRVPEAWQTDVLLALDLCVGQEIVQHTTTENRPKLSRMLERSKVVLQKT
jgi:hypothetical protein